MAKKPRAAAKQTPVAVAKRPDKRNWDVILAALLLAATLAAYWPALNGEFLWDDDAHVTKPELRDVHGLWRIWFDLGATQQYYPLLHSAFWIEHQIWGDSVLGYHLINVLLHAISALLVVLIVRRFSLRGAWLAGFIFALHPVCTEAVSWISEQKSTLSTVFYLSSAFVYLGFDRSRERSKYFLALALFVMALMSKTVTATLPAALLVVLWWQRGRLRFEEDVLPLAPWLSLGVFAGLFTAWVEKTYIGAEGLDFTLTLAQRLLLAGRVIWFYLGKLVLPVNLAFIYPRWILDPSQWWQWLFPLGIVAVAGALLWIARKHRGPLAGFLFFGGTLFPVLGFFNVYPFIYSYVADHFQYVASLGIIVPAAVGLTLVAGKIRIEDRGMVPAAGAVLILALAVITYRHNGIYHDAETLYRKTIASNPDCWMAHNNLGSIVSKQPGHMQEAIAEYETALRLRSNYPEAHNNLGNALLDIPGRQLEAVAHLRAALPIKGNQAVVRSNLGLALSKIPGHEAEAISEYEAALRMRPDLTAAHYNLGMALTNVAGRLPDAIAQLETAIRGMPDSAPAHCNLGMALAKDPARQADAMAEYQSALRIDPNLVEAHYNLGLMYSQMPDHLADAVTQFDAAIRLRPGYLEAHYNDAVALSKIPGRLAEAAPHLEAVLRARPDLDQVRQMLNKIRGTQR